MKFWNLSFLLVALFTIFFSVPSLAQIPGTGTSEIRIGLGVGGVYEFYQLDGAWFGGGGPSAELSLELGLGKNAALGLGARYRSLTALGPDPTATSAAIIEVNNTDYFGYLRVGWLDLLAGATQFSGRLLLVNGSGQEIVEKSLIPLGGIGFNFLPTKRLKGRIYGVYTFGEAFGYSMSSIQIHATLSLSFP